MTVCTSLIFSINIYAQTMLYRVEKDDQLGIIFLSLGIHNLWSIDGKINQFKKSSNFSHPNSVRPGQVLKIKEPDIIFKNNILIINNNYFTIRRKIKTYSEFLELQKTDSSTATGPPLIEVIETGKLNRAEKNEKKEKKLKSQESLHALDFYLGAGSFIASDTEIDRSVTSNTMTGLQPMVQLKAIYSNDNLGSFAVDFLTKKILSSQYNFPINADYRIQYLPKWNVSNYFKLALSHSILQHSYVGKNSDTEIAYELKSNFLGIGLVFPQEQYWFEFYVEKAYRGETKSNERTQQANAGIRFDTELVYSLSYQWKIIPGLNYYELKDAAADYNFSVYEARVSVAREFEF